MNSEKSLPDIIDLQREYIKTLSERIDILNKRMDLAIKNIEDLQSDFSELSGFVQGLKFSGRI
jgi:hypothetical protein